MVSLRSTKKMTLSATDEFWHSPILSDLPSPDAGNDHEQQPTMSLPTAHHQLLSGEQTSFENLKGYDHTATLPNVDFDGYSSSSEGETSASSNSWCARQKLSAVKQQGGGSWLLGFARLNDKPSSPSPVEEEEEDMTPPGLVSSLDSDEDSASTASSTDVDSDEDDDDSVSKPATASQKRARSGVSFSESVTIQPIPHSSTLSPMQRRKMYSTSWEVRQNKIRNKKEYRYDGYDWRNVTEEWEMGVDMVTGELVHPAHEN